MIGRLLYYDLACCAIAHADDVDALARSCKAGAVEAVASHLYSIVRVADIADAVGDCSREIVETNVSGCVEPPVALIRTIEGELYGPHLTELAEVYLLPFVDIIEGSVVIVGQSDILRHRCIVVLHRISSAGLSPPPPG